MSRRTSSLSTLTTVPLTMSPSSKLTIVPAMASSSERPSRSSATTCFGTYSPSSGAVGASTADCGSACSDITRRLLSGLLPRPHPEDSQRASTGYTFGDHEQFRMIHVRRAPFVPPGRHRPQPDHLEGGFAGEQTQLPGRVAGRPEVEASDTAL